MPKQFIYFFSLVLILSGLTSCNNTLNIEAPYKDITVVYGLLDQNDTAHYIRINKAYLGQGNALTMAQQYDSINYPAGTLNVVLQDFNNGNLIQTITLGTTMAIPVVPGIFSYPNQIEYYTNQALNVNDQYNLVITNTKTKKVVTGSTSLLPDIALNGIGSGSTFPMSWFVTLPSQITWFSVANGDIYQLSVRIFYTETVGASNTSHYVDWVFSPQITTDNNGGDPMIYSYTGIGFLQALHGLIAPAVGSMTRVCDSLEIIFATGSSDFSTYEALSQPSVGVNQDKPFYTDLTNGIGIFSTRHTQVYHRFITGADEDSINTDPISSNLGFVP